MSSQTFWSWGGKYVGCRLSDALFNNDGQQLGYFAEGDEVYACTGGYLGEIRGVNRLITNLKKKAWTRSSLLPNSQKCSPGHPDLNAKEMLTGFEDFPIAPRG